MGSFVVAFLQLIRALLSDPQGSSRHGVAATVKSIGKGAQVTGKEPQSAQPRQILCRDLLICIRLFAGNLCA